MITESDDIARALHDAAEIWPADRERPVKLLLRLVEEGRRAVLVHRDLAVTSRREAIIKTEGALTGVYGEGYLEAL